VFEIELLGSAQEQRKLSKHNHKLKQEQRKHNRKVVKNQMIYHFKDMKG
jgi:hypothetical protein